MDPENERIAEDLIASMDVSSILPNDAHDLISILSVKKQEAFILNDYDRVERIKNLITALNYMAPIILPKKASKTPAKSPARSQTRSKLSTSSKKSINSSQNSTLEDDGHMSFVSELSQNSIISQSQNPPSESYDPEQIDQDIQELIRGNEVTQVSENYKKALKSRINQLRLEAIECDDFEQAKNYDKATDTLRKQPNPSIERQKKRLDGLYMKREMVQRTAAEEEERYRFELQALMNQYNEAKDKLIEDTDMKKYIAEEEYVEQKDIKRHTNFAEVENLKKENQKLIAARNYSNVKVMKKRIAKAQEKAENKETQRMQKAADAKYEKKNAEIDNQIECFNKKWDLKIGEFKSKMEVSLSKFVVMIESLDKQIHFYQLKLHESSRSSDV